MQNAEVLKQVAIYKNALACINERFGEMPDKLRFYLTVNVRSNVNEPRMLLKYRLEFSNQKYANEMFNFFHEKVKALFVDTNFACLSPRF